MEREGSHHGHGGAELEQKDAGEIHHILSKLDIAYVFGTMHPMETHSTFGTKPLSLIQKAITCCINELGGSATAEQILVFVRHFWADIVKQGERAYKGIPDKRILHVALSNKRFGMRLFTPSPNDPGRYIVNPVAGVIEKHPVMKEEEDATEIEEEEEDNLETNGAEMVFDERVLNIVWSSKNGVRMEAITRLCNGHETEDGSFRHLRLNHRVRACLLLLKIQKRVVYNAKTGRWRICSASE